MNEFTSRLLEERQGTEFSILIIGDNYKAVSNSARAFTEARPEVLMHQAFSLESAEDLLNQYNFNCVIINHQSPFDAIKNLSNLAKTQVVAVDSNHNITQGQKVKLSICEINLAAADQDTFKELEKAVVENQINRAGIAG